MNDKKIGVFVSIPKCASKTVLKMLELGRNRDLDHQEKTNRFVVYENHQRLCVLNRKFDLSELFVFTFVRHPYARIKSWYFYHRSLDIHPYNSMDLETWVQAECPTHWTIQNQTNWAKENKSPLLQYNFIEGFENNVDFIGKIENFKQDMSDIISALNLECRRHNIAKKFKYKELRENVGPKSDDSDQESLTEKSRRVIDELFRNFLHCQITSRSRETVFVVGAALSKCFEARPL